MEPFPPAQWVNEVNPHLQSKRFFSSTITLLLVFPKILKYRSILRQNSFIFGHYLIFKMECLPAVPEERKVAFTRMQGRTAPMLHPGLKLKVAPFSL